MATITLKSADRFPAGTVVAAYPLSNWLQSQLPPSGAPQGASTASATVAADGSLALTGLADNTRYAAYAQVGGQDRYVSFSTLTGGSVDDRVLALESNRLLLLAYGPDPLLTGALTRDGGGALIAASASWPDGATGVYAGTPSAAFPGAIDSYTITHVLSAVTTTYTQPTLTRNADGAVTARPAITVT